MRIRAIQRVTGLLLIYFSLSMLPPGIIAWATGEPTLGVFLSTFALVMSAGVVLWLPVRRHGAELRLRDGFLTAAALWIVLSLVGAIPFLYSPALATVDAVFESVSGLTTTGATVIHGLDDLPLSVLYYRQQLQWLGGMGVIIFAVAVLPILGVGGMQIYRIQTPGPMKYNKLTARITETARALWLIYITLTIACAAAYWLAGMSLFDAVALSMSTVSLGAFTPHDGNFGYFDSALVETIAVVFMLIAGTNFALHFLAWREGSARVYVQNLEFRIYLRLIGSVALVTAAFLFASGTEQLRPAIQQGIFQAVSIATTAGYTTAGYYQWPPFVVVLLLMASFVGGCAGSTGGGIKVVRAMLLVKQGLREIRRLIHPSAAFQVKVDGLALESEVIDSVWGFFSLYIACFCVMVVILAMTGLDLVTAFSAVTACINNVGPAQGDAAGTYASIGELGKWVLCLAMIIGRLEVFTLLVLLMPGFWKK
jgi:trk system potassium uptake protein TrkH